VNGRSLGQITTLTAFLVRDLARSLAGAAPPALTLILYTFTFTYPATIDYFTAVGGASLQAVTFVSTLLMAWRINRGISYPWLVLLRRRGSLLAALALSTLAVSVAMALLFTALALIQRKIDLSALMAVQIGLRWLPLFGLTIGAGLLSSKLVSRGGTYLVVPAVLAAFFTVDEWRGILERNQLGGVVEIVSAIAWPVRTLLLVDPLTVTGSTVASLIVAALLCVAATLLLFWLSVRSFERKDLIWVE
jgi:hypothetical protein